MAVTQSQIDKLEAALAAGTLKVRHGDKMVTYDNFDQMRKRLEYLERRLRAKSKKPAAAIAGFKDGHRG